MTIEEKANRWISKYTGIDIATIKAIKLQYHDNLRNAYIGSTEENGIAWHDLRKNPDDLPKENFKVYLYAKDKEYHIGFLENGAWKYEAGFYASDNFVIAWTYIPEFEEKGK